MTKGWKATVWAGMALLLPGWAAGGDVVTINPGLWESTTTIENSFMGSMPPHTTTECVREREYDIQKLLSDQGACTLTDTSVNGPTLSWTMSCKSEGGPSATGSGQITSHGDQVEGHMTMEMAMPGQTMQMKTSWTGRRIGDC